MRRTCLKQCNLLWGLYFEPLWYWLTHPKLNLCRRAAYLALLHYPGGMQVGGGITLENATQYLEAGASHVIVTSYVFRDGRLDTERLDALVISIQLFIVPKCCLRMSLAVICHPRVQTFQVAYI